MIEQVGYDDEDDRLPVGQPDVGDRGREVGLARAGRARQQEPAARLSRESARVLDDPPELLAPARIQTAALGIEVIERQPGQRAEVAQPLEALPSKVLKLLGPARAGE